MKSRFKKEDATHLIFDHHVIWQLVVIRFIWEKIYIDCYELVMRVSTSEGSCQEKHLLKELGFGGGFLHWGKIPGHDMV